MSEFSSQLRGAASADGYDLQSISRNLPGVDLVAELKEIKNGVQGNDFLKRHGRELTAGAFVVLPQLFLGSHLAEPGTAGDLVETVRGFLSDPNNRILTFGAFELGNSIIFESREQILGALKSRKTNDMGGVTLKVLESTFEGTGSWVIVEMILNEITKNTGSVGTGLKADIVTFWLPLAALSREGLQKTFLGEKLTSFGTWILRKARHSEE